jgi:Ni2+-binding GTPase involved in maturation of urease and hydrogenase
MQRDSALVREGRPFVFTNCRAGIGVEAVVSFLETASSRHANSAGLWAGHDHSH